MNDLSHKILRFIRRTSSKAGREVRLTHLMSELKIDINEDALLIIERDFKGLYSGELGISSIPGGQSAANAALAKLDISGYANRRSQLYPKSARGATVLSPYIRHNILTLPQVYKAVSDAPFKDKEKYQDELYWQEYARHLYARVGVRLFENLRYEVNATTQGDGWNRQMLCIDESHRLNEKSGFYKNLGVNQIKEIIDASKTSVFFIDEAQKVTWADIGEISEIERFAKDAGASIQHLELKSQFRCSGSDDYLAWLDDALGVESNSDHFFSTSRFDFKIFDSVSEMRDVIFEKNKVNNKSRLVAGYCWNWVSKKDPRLNDIVFPKEDFAMKWNLASYAMKWIIEKASVNEIGCIHTCQGLECDYVGVIVGKDLIYRDGELTTDVSARAKTDGSLRGYKKFREGNEAEADVKVDEIIRNTYRTLMTRGMKGCYVYFEDKKTAEYFKKLIPTN